MGKITHGVVFDIKYNGVPRKHLFYIANIRIDDLILGYLFFEVAKPRINWKEGRMDGIMVLEAKTRTEHPTEIWIAKQ